MASRKIVGLSLELPLELRDELAKRAEQEDRKLTAAVRVAIRHYLDCPITREPAIRELLAGQEQLPDREPTAPRGIERRKPRKPAGRRKAGAR